MSCEPSTGSAGVPIEHESVVLPAHVNETAREELELIEQMVLAS